MKEGYLQIKISELSEQVKQLEDKIDTEKEVLKKLLDEIKKKEQELKPLIEQKDFIYTFKKDIEKSIIDKVDNDINIIQHELKNQLTDAVFFTKNHYVKKQFEEIQAHLDNEITALVDTLNLKMNLGIVFGKLPKDATEKEIQKVFRTIDNIR